MALDLNKLISDKNRQAFSGAKPSPTQVNTPKTEADPTPAPVKNNNTAQPAGVSMDEVKPYFSDFFDYASQDSVISAIKAKNQAQYEKAGTFYNQNAEGLLGNEANFLDKFMQSKTGMYAETIGKGLLTSVAKLPQGIDNLIDLVAGNDLSKGNDNWTGRLAKTADTYNELRTKTDPLAGTFGYNLSEGVGSMMSFMIPSTVVGKVGGAVTKGASYLGQASKFLSGLEKASPYIGRMLASGSMVATEASQEMTDVYNDVLSKTGDAEKAQRNAKNTFYSNAILIGATNKLSGFFEPLEDGAKAVVKRIITSYLSEGTQEGTQSIISNINTGRDWSEDVADSFFIGGIIGSGATLASSNIFTKNGEIDMQKVSDIVENTQQARQDIAEKIYIGGKKKEEIISDIIAEKGMSKEDATKLVDGVMSASNPYLKTDVPTKPKNATDTTLDLSIQSDSNFTPAEIEERDKIRDLIYKNQAPAMIANQLGVTEEVAQDLLSQIMYEKNLLQAVRTDYSLALADGVSRNEAIAGLSKKFDFDTSTSEKMIDKAIEDYKKMNEEDLNNIPLQVAKSIAPEDIGNTPAQIAEKISQKVSETDLEFPSIIKESMSESTPKEVDVVRADWNDTMRPIVTRENKDELTKEFIKTQKTKSLRKAKAKNPEKAKEINAEISENTGVNEELFDRADKKGKEKYQSKKTNFITELSQNNTPIEESNNGNPAYRADFPIKLLKLRSQPAKKLWGVEYKGNEFNLPTDDPITVMFDVATGKYILEDGANRVSLAMAKGVETIDAHIEVIDSTNGYASVLGEKYQSDTFYAKDLLTDEEVMSQINAIPFLASLKIEKVKNITRGDGGLAWGSYFNELIKYVENPKATTLPHEAFHAFTDLVLDDKERSGMFNLARETNKDLKEASSLDVEEWLAEDFAKWFVEKQNTKPETLLEKIYRKISDALNSLFSSRKSIQDYYWSVLDNKNKRIVDSRITSKSAFDKIRQEMYNSEDGLTLKSFKLIQEKLKTPTTNRVTLQNLIKGLAIKSAEKEVLNNTLDGSEFDGKFTVEDFIKAVQSNMLDIQVVPFGGGRAYSNYGLDNLGVVDDNEAYTFIVNTGLDHGYTGHFPSEFSNDKISKNNLEIKKIEAGTHDVNGQTQTVKEDQYYVMLNWSQRAKMGINETNIDTAVYGKFKTEEEAQNYIDNFEERKVLPTTGLMGHFRINFNGDYADVLEIQSDTFQKRDISEQAIYEAITQTKEEIRNLPEIKEIEKQIEELSHKNVLVRTGDLKYQDNSYVSNALRGIENDTSLFEANGVPALSVSWSGAGSDFAKLRELLVNKYGKDNFFTDTLSAEDIKVSAFPELEAKIKSIVENKKQELEINQKKIEQFQGFKNTYHELFIRQIIQQASMRGATKVRFPSPHKVATIEGYIEGRNGGEYMASEVDVGNTITYEGDNWYVLSIADDDQTFTAIRDNGRIETYDENGQEEVKRDKSSQFEDDLQNGYEDIDVIYEEIDVPQEAIDRINEVRQTINKNRNEKEYNLAVYDILQEYDEAREAINDYIDNKFKDFDVEQEMRDIYGDENVRVDDNGVVYVSQYSFDERTLDINVNNVSKEDFDINSLNEDQAKISAKYGISNLNYEYERPMTPEEIETWKADKIKEAEDYIKQQEEFIQIAKDKIADPAYPEERKQSNRENLTRYEREIEKAKKSIEEIRTGSVTKSSKGFMTKVKSNPEGKDVEGAFYKYLKKYRPDLRTEEDELGYDVYVSDLTPMDRLAIERFQKKDDKASLAVVHNLSEENLLFTNDLGSLVNPSIATIDTEKQMIDGYGDVTLIGTKDLLSKGNTYRADVYSPRYPQTVFPASYSQVKAVMDDLKPLVDKIGEELPYFDEYDIFGSLERSGAFVKMFIDKTGLNIPIVKEGDESVGRSIVYSYRKARTPDISYQFNQFINNYLKDFGIYPQHFNGYTYSGKRRYLPATKENALKIMKAQDRSGEGFNYGLGNLRAKLTPKMKLSEVSKNKNKLVTTEEFEKARKEMDDRYWELALEFSNYSKYKTSSLDVQSGLADYITGWKQFLDSYENVPKELLDKVEQFKKDLIEMPTEYFETKVKGEMKLSEFKYALVPKNTSEKIRSVIKENGLEIIEYDPSIKNDRAEKVKSVDGIKFQGMSVDDIANRYFTNSHNIYMGLVASQKNRLLLQNKLISLKPSIIENPNNPLGAIIYDYDFKTPNLDVVKSIKREIASKPEYYPKSIKERVSALVSIDITDPNFVKNTNEVIDSIVGLQGVSTTKASSVSGRLLGDKAVKYEVTSFVDQIAKAQQVIEDKPEDAKRIALGEVEAPAGLTATAVNIELAKQALEKNDMKSYVDFVNKRSLIQSKRGQEIVMENIIEKDSVDDIVKQVIERRKEIVRTKYTSTFNLSRVRETYEEVKENVKKTARRKINKALENQIVNLESFLDTITC